ncbi:hypothetical protein WME89_29865 [Sorangium sp. So ce321]|uniref:hypothetical protein n=1 Tax=Sorangium sp. So ce321 TaxID=3133300 RepID=UPI003F62B890
MDTWGVSPSLSLRSDCQTADDARETVDCAAGNAAAFSGYFSRRWGGEVPFPAAHFYYDGVVLIAMGLAFARATSGATPSSGHELQRIILGAFLVPIAEVDGPPAGGSARGRG